MLMLRFLDDLGSRRPRRAANHAAPTQTPGAPRARSVEARDANADSACYACSCGYVFNAAVSTSVSCPHCGARQAW